MKKATRSILEELNNLNFDSIFDSKFAPLSFYRQIIKEKTKSLVKIKKKMMKKVQDFSESMCELMDNQWSELDALLKQINVKN